MTFPAWGASCNFLRAQRKQKIEGNFCPFLFPPFLPELGYIISSLHPLSQVIKPLKLDCQVSWISGRETSQPPLSHQPTAQNKLPSNGSISLEKSDSLLEFHCFPLNPALTRLLHEFRDRLPSQSFFCPISTPFNNHPQPSCTESPALISWHSDAKSACVVGTKISHHYSILLSRFTVVL